MFLGRRRDLAPSIFPSIDCSCDESCLIICPIYCNFLVLNCITISLPVPILLDTSLLVIFSVHDIPTSQRHQVWTTEILQLSMSLLHRIVSARHNIWLLLIGYSGLFIDMIVVLSCWWMWSVLSLFFSWSPFRISHPQILSSQHTYMMLLVKYVVYLCRLLTLVRHLDMTS